MTTKPSAATQDHDEQQEEQTRPRRTRRTRSGCGEPDACRGRSARPVRRAWDPLRASRRSISSRIRCSCSLSGIGVSSPAPVWGSRVVGSIIGSARCKENSTRDATFAPVRLSVPRSRSSNDAGRAAPRAEPLARCDPAFARRRPIARRAAARAVRHPADTAPSPARPSNRIPPSLPGKRAVELGDGPVEIRADVGGIGERPGPRKGGEVGQAGLQGRPCGPGNRPRAGASPPAPRAPAARAGSPRRRPGRARTSPRGPPTSGARTAPRRDRRCRSPAGAGGAPPARRAAAPGWPAGCSPGRRSCGSPMRPSRLAGLLPHAPQPPDRQGLQVVEHALHGHVEHARRACTRRRRAWPRTSWGRPQPSTSRRPRAQRPRGSWPRSSPGGRTAAWRPPRPGTPRRARSAPPAA